MPDLYTIEETPETDHVFAALLDRLNRLSASDVKPIVDTIRAGFAENFASERAGNTPWTPLAPSTVLDRITHGFGGAHKILQRTRSYLGSFQGGGDHIERTLPDSNGLTIEVGSRHTLTSFHEAGTSRMPARPVAVLSQETEQHVFAELDHLFRHLLSDE